jgi:hypothetical protein
MHPRPVLGNNQFKVSNLMSTNDTGLGDGIFNTIDESRLSKKRMEDVEASIAG